jgi:hypothetical protein
MRPSGPVNEDCCFQARTIEKRCDHCFARYTYSPSDWPNPLNDSRYCPSCKETILKALKTVPRAVFKELLPVPLDDEMTIARFKEKYAEWEATVMLKSYQIRYGSPENFKYKDLSIGDVDYVLITNADTGEELLCVNYETSAKTQEIEDLWHEI